MLKIATKNEIDNYFKDGSLNQSQLKKLAKGVEAYKGVESKSEKDLYYEEKDSWIIGGAVDCKLLGEEGDFEKCYYPSKLLVKPSDAIMSIINEVFDGLVEFHAENPKAEEIIKKTELPDLRNLILLSVEKHSYQGNWKEDTRINKVISEGENYFRELKNSIGKQILSLEDVVKIDAICNSLQTNPRTSRYFNRGAIKKDKNVTVYYQKIIFFEHRGIACKAMLDLVVEVKDEKTGHLEVFPFDLKTTGYPTKDFLVSIKKFRYDIQAAWYKRALNYHYTDQKTTVFAPFTFIVESTSVPGQPLLFSCSPDLEYIGHFGREAIIVEKEEDTVVIKPEILGYEQLLDIFLFHQENGWHEDMHIQQCNGRLTVDWDGLKR